VAAAKLSRNGAPLRRVRPTAPQNKKEGTAKSRPFLTNHSDAAIIQAKSLRRSRATNLFAVAHARTLA
jgi:hypothetical protein